MILLFLRLPGNANPLDMTFSALLNVMFPSLLLPQAVQDRQGEIHGAGEGMDQEVRHVRRRRGLLICFLFIFINNL